MRLATISAACLLTLVAASGLVRAQNRGGGSEWPTVYADAQRTSWIRNDAAISVESMSKPGFELQWMTKLAAQARQSNSLFQGVTVNGVMLFHPLTIVTGASNRVSAIDMETGYLLWDRQYDLPASTSSTGACPGGITAAAARVTNLIPPAPTGARGGGGGRGGYTSAVGEPGEGAPVPQRAGGGGGRATTPPAGAGAAAAGRGADPAGRGGDPAGARGAGAAGRGADPVAAGRGGDPVPAGRGADPAGRGGDPARAGGPGGGGGGRGGTAVYAISGDGLLHTLGPSSGKDVQRPTPFLAANARFSDPIVIGNMMYATTSGNCGGAADGVWALDLSNDSRPVASWRTNGGSPVGPIAFTTDGTLIVAIGPGSATAGGYSNAIVALDPKTLQPKDWFTQPSTEFVAGPLVFVDGDKTIVAAVSKDGRVLLLDAASLGGANHSTPLHVSRSFAASSTGFAPGALAMWQQMIPIPAPRAAPAAPPPATPPGPPAPPAPTVTPGTRWLLLPISGGLPPGLGVPTTSGAITNGAILALKVLRDGGKFSIEPGWVSPDLSSPATPLIVNGVVFGLSSGNRTQPAVLHAWDGMSGRELWNSGKTIVASVTGSSFWSGTGQVYVGTGDGAVYAFGFAMERK